MYSGVSMPEIVIIHGSIIKYRGDVYILYPAKEDREKLKKLHRKKVHAIIIED